MQYTHPTSVRSKLNNPQTLHPTPFAFLPLLHLTRTVCVCLAHVGARTVCVCVTRGVIVQAHPLPTGGSAYPTQHNTTYASTRTHAEREGERERDRETHVHTYTQTHTQTHTHKHTHKHKHTHTLTHVYTHTHTSVSNAHICT